MRIDECCLKTGFLIKKHWIGDENCCMAVGIKTWLQRQAGYQIIILPTTCTSDKGKQTNKQVEVAHAEVRMQGVVRSCVTCRVKYAMHQSMQKSFGDASEMHWKSMEFDMQGHTLTLRCHRHCHTRSMCSLVAHQFDCQSMTVFLVIILPSSWVHQYHHR